MTSETFTTIISETFDQSVSASVSVALKGPIRKARQYLHGNHVRGQMDAVPGDFPLSQAFHNQQMGWTWGQKKRMML